MDPLLAIALFWAAVATVSLLMGIACIKYGVYTAGDHENRATLEV